MKGIIISNFTIETDGRVNNAKLKSSDLEDKNTEDCILETINSLKFEPLKNGKNIVVTVPYNFKKYKN